MNEQEQQRLFEESMKAWDEYRRKRAIKALFHESAFDSEIKDLNRIHQLFCWFKTLICLLAKRTNGSYLDSNMFCVLSYDESSTDMGSSWEAVWVNTKIFSGWKVCIAMDGT